MSYEPPFDNLVSLLGNAIEQHGPRPAFGTLRKKQWVWTSYAEFGQAVEHCRAGLALLGAGRGDRVAIISDNRVEWVIAAHATYQRRAIYVPMYEAQADTEWKYILGDAGAKVCIVANQTIAERVNELREDLLDLQHIVNLDGAAEDKSSFLYLLQRGSSRAIKARTPHPSDVATIIYTSGTTGEPKGVRLTHRNLATNACALAEQRDYGPDPRSMAFLPWAHVFGGAVELNVAMAIGGCVAICRNADQLFSEMSRVKPTMLYAVPRIWTRLYHDIKRELAREPEMSRSMFDGGLRLRAKQQAGEELTLTERIFLRTAERFVISKVKGRLGAQLRLGLSGAAPLPVEVAEFMDYLGLTIHEGYGLTESSGSSTTNPSGAVRFGSVGKPIKGTRIEIDTSIEEAEGREGEILVHGHGVMLGYHNNPDATASALTEDGGLRTGDLGYVDEDGYVFITGRLKELYKLNSGRYVAPAPLEAQLCLSTYISQCMIYGSGQPYSVALIVADVPAVQAFFGGDHGPVEQMLADPRTRQLFEDEILRYSRDFRKFELVRNFWLITEPFSRANGMLTQTLKLKRRRVLRSYEAKLKSLY